MISGHEQYLFMSKVIATKTLFIVNLPSSFQLMEMHYFHHHSVTLMLHLIILVFAGVVSDHLYRISPILCPF